MKNQNASSSKVVATRLPMINYITILNEASSRNMSLSEYVTLKLFSEEKNTEELLSQIKTLRAQELELRNNCAGKSDTIKKMKEEITELSTIIIKCINDSRLGGNNTEMNELRNEFLQYIRKKARMIIENKKRSIF